MTNDELEAVRAERDRWRRVAQDAMARSGEARAERRSMRDRAERAEAHAERLAAVMAEFIAAEDSLIAEIVAVGETVDSCSAPFPLVAKMRQALSAYRGEMKTVL